MAKNSTWENEPWRRGNDSLVAVNPERITTLLELAVSHYGRKCAKCGTKGNRTFIVHHRHYRTVGFEKPIEDIVLLCRKCHDDLHERAKNKMISQDDLPFVDPEWGAWLPTREKVEHKQRADREYRQRIADLKTYPVWEAVFRKQDGVTVKDQGRYKDEEEARRNFQAECEWYGYLEIVSIEKVLEGSL